MREVVQRPEPNGMGTPAPGPLDCVCGVTGIAVANSLSPGGGREFWECSATSSYRPDWAVLFQFRSVFPLIPASPTSPGGRGSGGL